MTPIFNMAVMPVCSKCRTQMTTEELNFEGQFAIVSCGTPSCEEYNSRYRLVMPVMQGEPVHAS